METIRRNWPLFICTAALALTPTWLAGQTRNDPLGLRKECNGGEILDAISAVKREVVLTGLQIDTLQKTIDAKR